MARRHDPTKVKRHWIYTRAQVGEIFDVGESTMTNWIAAGLKPVDEKRPQHFQGYELRRYLTEARWPDGRAQRMACCFATRAMVLRRC